MGRIEVFNKFKRLYYWLHHECYNKLLNLDHCSEEFYLQFIFVNRIIRHADNELILMNNFRYRSFEISEVEELKSKYEILKNGFEDLKTKYSAMINQNL